MVLARSHVQVAQRNTGLDIVRIELHSLGDVPDSQLKIALLLEDGTGKQEGREMVLIHCQGLLASCDSFEIAAGLGQTLGLGVGGLGLLL